MIPLNVRQGLPPQAFWYLMARSVLAALLLAAIAALAQLGSHVPGSCRGALCGKLSGGTLAALLYILATYVVVHAVLAFRWFSYVLTDKSISISSGIFFQRSCTIRFDRIQDIAMRRDPLHALLGLKSLAIWTASPDQRAGNARRPDGQIVLEADTADWLRDYLSDPPAAGGAAVSHQPMPAVDGQRTPRAGLALLFGAAVLVVVAVLALSHRTSVTPAATSAAATAPALPAPLTQPSAPARIGTHRHLVAAVPATAAAVPGARPLVCAIHGAGDMNGVKPCAELNEAQRCSHEGDFRSQPTTQPAQLTIENGSDRSLSFYWLNQSGVRVLYASLPPGGHVSQESHIGAHWLLSTQDGRCIGILNAATMTVGVF